jgi:PPOX class probable F420-dependent enzyme
LNASQLAFMGPRRTATLATVSLGGQPRLVPICFVLGDEGEAGAGVVLYSPLDEKPKRGDDVRNLARVRDIHDRPSVTLLFDRWSEDWSRLAWLRARGTATLMEPGDDPERHRLVVRSLRDKYPQYHQQLIEAAPLIQIVIEDVSSWGALAGPEKP